MTETTVPNPGRRNLFGGIALSMLLPRTLSAEQVKARLDALDPVSLCTLVRGLSVIDLLGDPVLSEDATALLAELDARLPGAGLMRDIHRLYPMGSYGLNARPESPDRLASLHRAVAEAHGVWFAYTDLDGVRTKRRVLPLLLVHPPQGVQLLAWCTLRSDFRKFFVRSTTDISADDIGFTEDRADLLARLYKHESDRSSARQASIRSTVRDPFV